MKIRNLLNAGILRIFIGVLMLLGSVGVSGQDNGECFEVKGHYSGYDFYPIVLKDSICSLAHIVDELDKDCFDFKVIYFDLSGTSQYMKKEDIESKIEKTILNINFEYPENIIIFKMFSEGKLDYHVSLQLPLVAPFDTITLTEQGVIAQEIENTMETVYMASKNYIMAELAGFLSFNSYMNIIGYGNLYVKYERFYYKLEKECIPLFKIEQAFPPQAGREEPDIKNREDLLVQDCSSYFESLKLKDFGNITKSELIEDIDGKLHELENNGISSFAIMVDKDYDENDEDSDAWSYDCSYEKAKNDVSKYKFGLVVVFLYKELYKIPNSKYIDRVYFWVHDLNGVKDNIIPSDNKYGGKNTSIVLVDKDDNPNTVEFSDIHSDGVIIDTVPWSMNNFLGKSLCGIGYSVFLSGSGAVGLSGYGVSSGLQRIVFFQGPYALFPYEYSFNEFSYAMGIDLGSADVNIQVLEPVTMGLENMIQILEI